MTTQITEELRSEIVERWSAKTAEQQEQVPRLPLDALLGEAKDLVGVLEAHFATKVVGGKKRLGLDSVAERSGVTAETANEIWELQTAISEVKNRYVNLARVSADGPVERADELLSEFRAVLGFLLESGESPEGAAQLAQLRAEYDSAHAHDAIALALEGYSELASQHRAAIESLGTDAGIINEALQVADALRQRSADRLVGKEATEQNDLMKLRNRLVGALQDRMANARRTIRFVFRNEPDIAEKATSRYFRDAKRKSRSKKAEVISGTEDTLEIASGSSAE